MMMMMMIVVVMTMMRIYISDGMLTTGFPRTVSQAEELTKSQTIDVVINLDVPFETIIERIKVGCNNKLIVLQHFLYIIQTTTCIFYKCFVCIN
jgi:adenylate kinase family enzyme